MTSQINPNNIDGAYPVAGQDNNSQGFRDNFTNIQLNFQYAATEITALQNGSITKGNSNDMGNGVIYNAVLRDISTPAFGNPQGTSVPVNYALGNYQTIITPNTTDQTTLSFTNWPGNGYYASVRLLINIVNAGYTIKLPTTVTGTNTAVIPTCLQNIQGYTHLDQFGAISGTLSFLQPGSYVYEFSTSTAGAGPASITIQDLTRNADPVFLPSTQEITDNTGTVDLITTTTAFNNPATGVTATLAAGLNGQVKVLTTYGFNGNVEVTVASAGWKSGLAGTITMNGLGQTVSLLCVNGRWFCTGSGPATGGTLPTFA